MAGATGYRVLYGAAPGQYSSTAEAGAATSYTVKGLSDELTYYFAVEAENVAGAGLPSSSLGVTPLAAGQVGALATWEFNGDTGGEATEVAAATAGGVSAGALTRGPGLAASASGWAASLRANRFASEPAGNHTYGSTLSAAIAAGQYYQFTIAPASGESLTLSSLSFLAYFQNGQGSAGVTYSTDGVNFSAGLAASGSASSSTKAWTVDLSRDVLAVTAPVTVRIYLYGDASYTLTALGDPSGRDLLVNGSVVTAQQSGPAAPPAAPVFRSAVSGDGTAALSWTAVTGATGYRVYYGTAPGQYSYTGSAEAEARRRRLYDRRPVRWVDVLLRGGGGERRRCGPAVGPPGCDAAGDGPGGVAGAVGVRRRRRRRGDVEAAAATAGGRVGRGA